MRKRRVCYIIIAGCVLVILFGTPVFSRSFADGRGRELSADRVAIRTDFVSVHDEILLSEVLHKTDVGMFSPWWFFGAFSDFDVEREDSADFFETLESLGLGPRYL